MTGLFFGSFNPIHTGHLIMAEYMINHAALDEVWFIVSPQNPLKEQPVLVKEDLRLQMVKLAVKDNKKFVANDTEFKLPKPSYTINTLEVLSKKYPKKKFALIMGADTLESLNRWKDYQKILNGYPILVFRRGFINEGEWKQHPGVIFFDTPLLKISSTLIRTMNEDKKSIRYLVPEKVREFIQKKRLYLKKKNK